MNSLIAVFSIAVSYNPRQASLPCAADQGAQNARASRSAEEQLGASSDPEATYRETVLPAKLILNLLYLRSKSFWRDMKLLYLTVRFSLFPDELDRDLLRKTFGAGVQNE